MYGVVREHCNLWQFSKIHTTIEEAKTEAERLCRKERATFYIVKMVSKCYLEEIPVTWKEVE